MDLYVQYKTHSGHVTSLSLTLSSSLCVCLAKGGAELHICRANSRTGNWKKCALWQGCEEVECVYLCFLAVKQSKIITHNFF